MKLDNKLLVTGGGGYIGSHFVESMITSRILEPEDIVVIDKRVETESLYKSNPNLDGVKVIVTDLARTTLEMWFSPETFPGFVIHFGEYSRIHPSLADIDTVFMSNAYGSYKLFRFCEKNSIPLLYAGSSTKLVEPGHLGSPYAFYKSQNVELLKAFAKWFPGFEYEVVYFNNVYGGKTQKHDEWRTVVDIYLDEYKNSGVLKVVGDGKQRRNFTHIDDVNQALKLVLSEYLGRGKEYVISSKNRYSILQLVEAFPDAHIQYVPKRIGERNDAPGLDPALVELGYEPQYDVIKWIKEQI